MSVSIGNGKIRWLPSFWLRTAGPKSTAHPDLLDARQFKRQLLRERARAERTTSTYILLHIWLSHGKSIPKKHNDLLNMLAEVVCERTRFTDVAGTHEGGIGLILPDTPREAAWELVCAIEQLFHTRLERRFGWDGPLPEVMCRIHHGSLPHDVAKLTESM